MRVGGNDVAGRTCCGENAELAIGLISAQQDREGVSEELRVLAISLAEEVGLRLAGQQARPGRSGRVGQVFEAHAGLLRCRRDVMHLVSRLIRPVEDVSVWPQLPTES